MREEPTSPSRLEVEYPDQLSRGLVWVKWWLLAIPQYLVVAAFNGGAGLHLGLIAVLSVIAGVTLAVTGQYPYVDLQPGDGSPSLVVASPLLRRAHA